MMTRKLPYRCHIQYIDINYHNSSIPMLSSLSSPLLSPPPVIVDCVECNGCGGVVLGCTGDIDGAEGWHVTFKPFSLKELLVLNAEV